MIMYIDVKEKDLWKIFTTDKRIVILTDAPKEFHNGDGVYYLMKQLQKIYGSDLCSFQKFDERFDKIEDFDIILKTGYNFDGNRLICIHLFEYDKKKETLTMDRQKSWKIVTDYEFVHSFKKTIVKCIRGFDGLREHILWTMGKNSCNRFWGDSIAENFGISPLFETERIKSA